MDEHWQRVRRQPAPARHVVTTLRVLAALALASSFGLCLRADHATMAPLVWLMALAGAALLVALALAWRPRWLAPCVMWLPARARHDRRSTRTAAAGTAPRSVTQKCE
jgi:hypothetical protein